MTTEPKIVVYQLRRLPGYVEKAHRGSGTLTKAPGDVRPEDIKIMSLRALMADLWKRPPTTPTDRIAPLEPRSIATLS